MLRAIFLLTSSWVTRRESKLSFWSYFYHRTWNLYSRPTPKLFWKSKAANTLTITYRCKQCKNTIPRKPRLPPPKKNFSIFYGMMPNSGILWMSSIQIRKSKGIMKILAGKFQIWIDMLYRHRSMIISDGQIQSPSSLLSAFANDGHS